MQTCSVARRLDSLSRRVAREPTCCAPTLMLRFFCNCSVTPAFALAHLQPARSGDVRSGSYCVTSALSPGLTKFSAHGPRVLIWMTVSWFV